jgi:protein-L-isoaspartate(D-aspartate) O-methyltransferase
MDQQAEAREKMVDEQIAQRGVRDLRVLAAMRVVPRHEFVLPGTASQAYADRALAIEHGQTISQPYMVARMTEELALPEHARVLEVGTGSGYQAAILGIIAAEVISVERHEALAGQARDRLVRLGYHNVQVIVADGTHGWPGAAPYDGIVVTAGAPAVPEALRQQLADAGRLVIPVGTEFMQQLTIVARRGGEFVVRRNEGCCFVPLIGEYGWPDNLAR